MSRDTSFTFHLRLCSDFICRSGRSYLPAQNGPVPQKQLLLVLAQKHSKCLDINAGQSCLLKPSTRRWNKQSSTTPHRKLLDSSLGLYTQPRTPTEMFLYLKTTWVQPKCCTSTAKLNFFMEPLRKAGKLLTWAEDQALFRPLLVSPMEAQLATERLCLHANNEPRA